MTRLSIGAAVMAATACSVGLDVPSEARIGCGGGRAPCPDGFQCVEEVGLCVEKDSVDLEAPGLESSSLSSPVLGPATALTVEIVPNEPLLVAPEMTLRSGDWSRALEPVPADGDTLAFSYLTTGDEPEGAAAVTASLVDVSGNVNRNVAVGEVYFDFTAPSVNEVTLNDGVSFDGTRWVNASVLSFSLDASDNYVAGVAETIVAGDVVAGRDAYGSSLSVELSAGDGTKNISIRFVDLAGNETEPVVTTVYLETTSPANSIVLDEPSTSLVDVNRDSYAVLFHSDGQLPADLEGYAVSTDQGTTWDLVGATGFVSLNPLPQNATTVLWIAERDVFGNETPAGSRAVLTIREDSVPPVVAGVTLAGAQIEGGVHWVDTHAIELLFDVTDESVDGVTALQIDGDVDDPGTFTFVTPFSAQLTSGVGAKALLVSFFDAAGNASSSTVLAAQVETSAPSNAIVVDVPAGNETWVNQDRVDIYFHSAGDPPADFDCYVASTDAGQTWVDIGGDGHWILEAVPQDATTTIWIRERDLFGNLTPASEQAVVTVHEDSQAPSKPEVLQPTLIGNFSTRAGVLLATPSVDPGGGPVTYQVFGGPLSDFTDAGSDPWVDLPGVGPDMEGLYIIRAADRAGNLSASAQVMVVDENLSYIGVMTCRPTPCNQRWGPRVSGGKGLYLTEYSGTVTEFRLSVCTRLAATRVVCGFAESSYGAPGAQDNPISHPNAGGRYVAFVHAVDGLVLFDLGPDGVAQTEDDGTREVVDATGRCPAPGRNGLVFAKADDALYFYAFGADGIYDPSSPDAGEGLTALPDNGAVVAGTGCNLRFDGRYVTWNDVRGGAAERYIYDLGPDEQLGTADDPGETLLGSTGFVFDSGRGLSGSDFIDYGPDRTVGTADDVTVVLPGRPGRGEAPIAISGDKVLYQGALGGGVPHLYDPSAGEFFQLYNETFAQFLPDEFALASGMLFTLGMRTDYPSTYPATYEFRAGRYGYWLGSPDWDYPGTPIGAISGGVAFWGWLGDYLDRPFTSLRQGGSFEPSDSWDVSDADEDVDIDGGRIVYRDPDGRIWLFDAGADGQPGSADDTGPVAIADTVAYRRWPRIDGNVVAWADLSADADGLWTGTDLDSQIRAVDLGSDGLPGGGDDVAYDVTTAGKEIMPDVSGDLVVWLDLRDDGDGLCVKSGANAVDATTCLTGLYGTVLGSGVEQPLVVGGNPVAAVQTEGDLIAWARYDAGDNWDIQCMRVGGGVRQLTDTPFREAHPTIDGERLGWYDHGPVVLGPGPDGIACTDDDVSILGSNAAASLSDPYLAPRHRWLDGDLAFDGTKLIDLSRGAELYQSGQIDLAIPDNDASGVIAEIEITAPSWQRVNDMRISVTIEHPEVRELELTLTSPAGDRVLLFSGAAEGSGTDLEATFTAEVVPALMSQVQEPLAGTWTLGARDLSDANTGGTLAQWQIAHVR